MLEQPAACRKAGKTTISGPATSLMVSRGTVIVSSSDAITLLSQTLHRVYVADHEPREPSFEQTQGS